MGVSFYLADSRLWDEYHEEHYSLGLPLRIFEILRDLLHLESPHEDNTGKLAADVLLVKLAQARRELQQHGKEWECSAEPPPQGQEGQSLQILGTPGVDLETLDFYLKELQRIACHATDHATGVKWD